MATLAEFRAQYPQYDAVPDIELANSLHQKFYSSIPVTDFYKTIGVNAVAPEEKGEPGFIPSIKRGGRGLASLATDIIPAMVGKATGNEEYAKKQLAEAAAYQKETERLYPAEIASYKDIGGVGDALTYVKEAIGEAIPSLIPSLVTGGVGGIAAQTAKTAAMQAAERIAAQEVARAATKNVLTKETLDSIRDTAISAGAKEAQKIALKYQAVGAVAGSAAQNIPDVYQNIYEATGQQDLGAALAFGGFNAALDAILPVNLLRKFTKTGISPEEVAAAWYKRAGKGAAKGFVTEGGTEALQEVSSAAAEKFVDKNQEFFSEKNFERFINSGLKGGFGGAGITAATDVAFGKGPEAKRKPATGKTILDTLAGDEDVAGINEPAGGESTGVAGESGAGRPPGGVSGTKSDRVVPAGPDAGRFDDGEGQPPVALTPQAFDDFNRQYNDLRQEAVEILELRNPSPADGRRLQMVQRDLAGVVDANAGLLRNNKLAESMKNPMFDARQALQDIQTAMDVAPVSEPRAMRGDLAGTRKDILDLTNRALAIGRQDVGKAVEYLQGLQQRSQELLPEQSTDSFWGRRTAPLVGMTTAEGFANPKKVAELYGVQQEQEIAEAIQRLQSTGQPRAMQGDMFAGQNKEAPIEGEPAVAEAVPEVPVERETAPAVSTEHIVQTNEGQQIKDFFDAIQPSSATPAEQEKHRAPKNAASSALLEFDIAKPGEETSPGVQAALRYLANRVGGIDSFQELLSRLKAAPAELQSGMFTRAGLPDLTTRRGMEEFSAQVQSYLDQSSGKGTGVQISKKSAAAPATGSFRGVMPYTEDISQGVSETVEYAPLSSGKPRRPEQRTVSKTYKISDTKLRSAVRVLREMVQLGGKLSAAAKAASTYLQNSNRETFGDALRDVAYDLAMFELDSRNYGANSTFYGEGGKYAQEFRTWIEQNLDAETIKLLDDLIADHKATAQANAAFEKSVSSYRKQLEDRAEKLRAETEKSTGAKIPKAPTQRSKRITETELGEQEETAEPEIPAKNLPRTRKLYEVHPAIKRAIEAGDTKLVLELMGQSKSDPYFALLAQRLLDANITAKTQMVGADEMSPLSNAPGIPATLDGYLTALRDLVITTLPQGKQGEIVRQLESNKLSELVEAFDSINNESGNFTDGQRQLLTDSSKFFNTQYNWNGKYDPNTDTMSLRIGALTNHLFLHEAVHATAEHLISNKDSLTGIRRQGYDQLNELFNHSKAMLALKGLTDFTVYGLTDIHEFVSEAMTNPEFQAMLRAIRYKASPYSLMSRFTDGIRKLFKIVDTAESNVLNEVIFATDAMLMGGVAGKELMTGMPRAAAGKRIPVGRPDSKTAISNMMTSRSWSEVQSQWPIFYSSLKASLRPIALGGLTLNQLGDLVNNRIPQVGNFIRVTEEYLSRKNQILNDSGAITKRWERLQVVDPDMSRKLGAVMHRATITELDPDRATAQQRNENVDLMTQWGELDSKAKVIYRDVRNFYEKRFSEYKRTLKKRVQLMRQYGVSETTINEIRNEFEKNSRKGPYFPLMRYGRFWYQVGKGNDREYYMFETFGELQAHLNERLERNPELEDSLTQGDQYQKQMDLHARESTFLKAAFDAVDNSSMGDKQGLKDELYQTWLANQPETSFRNRFIHRKAVEGFSQDALRNFSSSSFHMAYQMSRFEYSPELFPQITAARSQLKERVDNTKRADPEVMRENNELSDYVQELERRMSTILNPEDVGTVVSLLSNVGFIYYLTSVASAATNILGGMVIGLPTLVSHQLRMNPNMSYTAATMASLGQMKNAAMQIMATGFSVDRGPRLRDNYVLFPSLDRSSSLSKMDRAAYNRFVADGVIDITAAYDQSGLASAPTAEYGGMRHRAMQAVSALFHNAERFNREVVAMSAFRTGMEKRAGYKDQQKAFTESIADAKNVTTQSMFDYSSVNKPRYMQSPAARILLQFKQFPQQMTFYLARNLQQSLAGATPEVKREARARFVGTMGMTGIFAGSTGLWGFSSAAAVVNAVMNGLGDDDEEPFDFELEYMNWASETFGKNLGMFMTRGAGNAAGVDLHSRVSLDDMWFRDGRKNTDEATALQEFLVSMLGPTAGIAVNAARAVDLYNQGHADRAIEAVSPGFIKQPLVAARYAREGVNTLKGDPLAEDIGPMDLLMQSLGFRPAQIAEVQYYNITKKGQEQAILKERQNLLNLFGISFMANDADANEKAFEKIMKFNDKHPSAAIPARSIIKSIKERATKSAQAQHGLHIDKRLQGLIDETYIDRLTSDEE